MTRGLTAAVQTAMADQIVRPCLFFEGEFSSGFLRLWTGVGDISWDSQTWIGAGDLIGVSDLSESSDVISTGLSVGLSGVPTDLVSTAINDAQQGLPGKVWIGLLDDAGAIIADPVQAFAGRLDVPTIQDGAETCTISISYESRLVDLQKPREFRYTDQSQRLFYPNDKGFKFITSLQDKEVRWGD